MENWRLIITSPMNGRMNMAIDEALLLSTVKNHTHPVLRLYTWQPGCLSLGYAQPVSDIDQDALRAKGWDYVRRPTGGRAILHIDELTYSISAPFDCPPVSGNILESYRRLSAGLLKALKYLGLSAAAEKEYKNIQFDRSHPVCFEVPSNYEITANGKKLIGSAQSRKYGGVLQHGTLPLFGDIGRINDVLAYPDEQSKDTARLSIYAHATTLEDVLGRRVTWEDASMAYVQGFSEALEVDFSESRISAEENVLAEQLYTDKYQTRAWNNK